MKLFRLVSSALALRLVGAYLVTPDGPAAPGSITDCSGWVQQSYGLTCAMIEELKGVTVAQFEAWNPSVTELGAGCTLMPDIYYCVEVNFAAMPTMTLDPPPSFETGARQTLLIVTTSMTVLAGSTQTTTTSTTLSDGNDHRTLESASELHYDTTSAIPSTRLTVIVTASRTPSAVVTDTVTASATQLPVSTGTVSTTSSVPVAGTGTRVSYTAGSFYVASIAALLLVMRAI